METTNEKILAILRIGHDTSMRGEGLSLRDALSRADYVDARKRFAAPDLVPVIQTHKEFIQQWLMYSEDKRTSGGWYLKETGEIGRADDHNSTQRFELIEDAVAEYVVRELDYWAAI